MGGSQTSKPDTIWSIASDINNDPSIRLGFGDDARDSLSSGSLLIQLRGSIVSVRRDIEKIDERYRESVAEIQSDAEVRELEASRVKAAIATADGTSMDLEEALKSLRGLLRDLDRFGGELLESNLDQSEYTLYATIAFGVLVAIVIGGFFWLALKNDSISISIFGDDRGIQFITLFSLVIAIILFGILRILEGKELSALLGGLSGYILGRGSIPGSQKSSQDTTKAGGPEETKQQATGDQPKGMAGDQAKGSRAS